MKKGFIVAIDGPVAAGKGTIAPVLSEKLNGSYLYTGAMYRCLALLCIEKKIDVKNKEEVKNLLKEIGIRLNGKKVFLNGKDVSERIKERDVARAVPFVALIPEVREEMVNRQRKTAGEMIEDGQAVAPEVYDVGRSLRSGPLIVAEGRDVGTTIFPNAELKVFLTASLEIRAKRRLKQLHEAGFTGLSLNKILKDVKRRDEQDSERKIDPLPSDPKALGYFVIDNSGLSEEATLNAIINEIKKRDLINDNS
ncbi:MAG: cytidylate kinase [Candidatus Levybacteria bacterium CG_4_10_14_0_8_um_filter_35_23]|nr:MAG: cytidylate kinase [Candidatus Levybacteria bacterium CG_4_10_14_0_8_um_filter_35_23]